jgi:hypothetical protein
VGKIFKITKKHVNFLRFIYLGMNQADAFIEAGFRAKTYNSASSGSSLLLEKLRNLPEGQQLFKAFNPVDEIAQDFADLRKHPDPRIRLDANKVAAGVHGLGKEEVSQVLGFQVIIAGRQLDQVGPAQEPIQIKAPKKPVSLLK